MLRISLLLAFVSSGALAHGGRLDRNGCHNDRKRGGYHCHRAKPVSAPVPPPKPPPPPRPKKAEKVKAL
jgi:hypothetical protein